MALSLTYSSLVEMLQSWCENDDDDFVDEIDRIIAMSELELQRDLNLEIFNTNVTGSILAGSAGRLISKPSDLLVTRSFSYTNSSNAIVYLLPKTVEYIETYWPNLSSSAAPKYYSDGYSDTQWLVGPCSDSTYTYKARYTKRPTGLSSNNTSTWLSTNVSDALFKCCMKNSEIFLKEDPNSEAGRINKFTQEYATALSVARQEFSALIQADYP